MGTNAKVRSMARITINDIDFCETISDLSDTQSSQVLGGTCWYREGEFLGCSNNGITEVIFTNRDNEIIGRIR